MCHSLRAYSFCLYFFFFPTHLRLLVYEYIAFCVCFIHVCFGVYSVCVFALHLRGECCNWYATSNKSTGRLPPLAIIWGDGFRGLSAVCVREFMLCFLKQRDCETTRRIACPRAAVGKNGEWIDFHINCVSCSLCWNVLQHLFGWCVAVSKGESHKTCQDRFLPKAFFV